MKTLTMALLPSPKRPKQIVSAGSPAAYSRAPNISTSHAAGEPDVEYLVAVIEHFIRLSRQTVGLLMHLAGVSS
ncbi:MULTISPECIES: hypothetical protein, partial [unclassified Variovorax]|uniref:hypothetical protein n=1 Tax=unclassified Variovorax TaxID=663243 RepID=UPI001BD5B167